MRNNISRIKILYYVVGILSSIVNRMLTGVPAAIVAKIKSLFTSKLIIFINKIHRKTLHFSKLTS